MEKKVRNAVRCFIIKDNKVVAIRYKDENKKAGFYDIPGGKIEDGETPEETAIREVKEETNVDVNNLEFKGEMVIEYPERIFNFKVFYTKEYTGEIKETEENFVENIDIEKLLEKEKKLSNIIILDKFLRNLLIEDTNNKFKLFIEVDDQENILKLNFDKK